MAPRGAGGLSAARSNFATREQGTGEQGQDAPLTLIKRAPPAAFAPWLAALPATHWPDGRFFAHVEDVKAGVLELFAQCETPLNAMAEWWAGDVAALAHRFVAITGDPLVDVRLERIDDNACSKFHRDNVSVRLITTYFGPGTELVPAGWEADALAGQSAYRGPLQRLEPGEIAVFRGGADGVLHRSPPVANTGISRAMLCLNTRFAASPELWTPATAQDGL